MKKTEKTEKTEEKNDSLTVRNNSNAVRNSTSTRDKFEFKIRTGAGN